MAKMPFIAKFAQVWIGGVIASGLALTSLPSLAYETGQLCYSYALLQGAEMALDKGCLGCHTLNTRRVGPAYSDIAARYERNATTERMLADKIKHGSTGTFGVAMPASDISDDDALFLARWILSLRGAPPQEGLFAARFKH